MKVAELSQQPLDAVGAPDSPRIVLLETGFCAGFDVGAFGNLPGLFVVSETEEAEKALADHPQARLWLLYDTPEDYLSTRMAEGVNPSHAIAEWSEWAKRLLSLQRRHRSVCLLMAVDVLEQAPDEAARLLDLPADLLAGFLPGRQSSDPVLTLIARQSLQDDFDLLACAGELEAGSALGVGETEAKAKVLDAAYTAYREAGQAVDVAAADLADAEISGLRQELEMRFLKEVETERRLARSHADLEQQTLLVKEARSEAKRHASTLEEREAELARMKSRLTQIKSGLDSYRVQFEEATADRDRLLAEMAALRDWMKGLTKTLSEQQERILVAEADWQAANATQRAETLTMISEKTAVMSELVQVRSTLARTEAELGTQRALVAAIRATRSYRLMAPLRRVRSWFNRAKG